MSVADAVRTQSPKEFLLSGAYHTPSGHLHLGHLGGPFLSADVIARHFEALGHRVTRITSTDAHEAYVLLASQLESRPPAEVASRYWESARDVLVGFDLHYDSFIDFSADPWKRAHHELCHEVADFLRRRQRLSVIPVNIPRARSGRFIIGPFAVGRCPLCGAEAAGTACEVCGMWFGPAELEDLHARQDGDEIIAWEAVPTVFLRAPDELNPETVEARFPPGYASLLERYLDHNKRELHVTHPLGWGVPWKSHKLGDGIVHVSYGTGSYAATKVTGLEYQRITGAELSPFHRDSTVTTVLTGGYDAALPCMMVIALTDPGSTFDPYRHHIMNQFMLLDGNKFSTSLDHVILGSTYLNAGLSPDLFRLYAAGLAPSNEKGNFVVSEFHRWTIEYIEGRLNRTVTDAFSRIAGESAPVGRLDAVTSESLILVLEKQVTALSLPDSNIYRAADVIHEWLVLGEETLATSSPYWWLKALAILAYPFMPRWSTMLWHSLGCHESPSLEELELLTATQPHTYVPLTCAGSHQVAELERDGKESNV